MNSYPIRAPFLTAMTSVLLSLPLHSQQQWPTALPSTSPTTPAATPPPPTLQPARIAYTAGQLTVIAANSSLNQVLREISRQTGMKISGGVAEERVFGTYGPSSPSKIITALLDGSGSNILLVQGAGTAAPVELVLTPRHGGPTPPNPSAPGFNDGSQDSPSEPFDPRRGNAFTPPAPIVPPSTPATPNQTAQPINPAPDSSSTNGSGSFPPIQPFNNSPTPPPDGTQQQSPNDVKTPQQIYEQLLRLRQQQAAPNP